MDNELFKDKIFNDSNKRYFEVSNIINNNSNGLYIKGTVNLKHFILLQDLLND